MSFVDNDGNVDPIFAGLMVKLASAYPSGKLTEIMIHVYARTLGDFPIDQLERACWRAIRESAFLPTVAELRKFIEPSVEDAALLAWAGFQRAASKVGAWASLEVEDPAAAEALQVVFGSWSAYCEVEGPALGARRVEFVAAYRQAARHGAQDSPPRRLAGLLEAEGRLGSGLGWVGRLTRPGAVQGVRARRQLPGAINQLTRGDDHGLLGQDA